MSRKLSIDNPTFIYLALVIGLAALLRMSFLSTLPNGFFADEASNAYDAYSILHTWRDQYGQFLPFFFKSANDYREGLYIYLMVPFIKLFGLNELGARITSAIVGTLTVLVLYYLARELFERKVALLSALLLAISPWHIQFSRITFRAITLPLLFCLSLLFFLKSLKQPKHLPISGVLFAVSIYTYNSARVFIPLFLIGLASIYRQHLWKYKRQTATAIILFLILFIPQFIYHLSSEGMARADTVGIQFNLGTIIVNYFSYFDPRFLFFDGDPQPRHLPGGMGELYYFEIVTVIWGLYSLFKHQDRTIRALLLLWLILYPLPAAFISPSSSVRTLVGTPLFALLSAYGIAQLTGCFEGKRKKIFVRTAIFIGAASLFIYTKKYFTEYPRWHPDVWLTQLGEVITYAHQSSHPCLVISDNVHSPYVYIMVPFYTQFPPAEYQRLGIDVADDRLDMGRWKVLTLDRQRQLNSDCLYIIKPEEIGRLEARGYQGTEVQVFKDINGNQNYKLVNFKKR